MGKKHNYKDVMASLAKQAVSVGGHEQMATLFAKWLVAGYWLQVSNWGGDDPVPGFDNLLEEMTCNEEVRMARIQQELLANGGTAVAGILRGVFGLHPESKLDLDQTQNPTQTNL